MTRDRSDRCPGVLRPWIADGSTGTPGAIVRLRLVGGAVRTAALHDLVDLAEQWGDGTVLLTKRTNLQLRGIEHHDGQVPAGLVDAVAEIGLLPVPSHELVRNVMVSPLTGLSGGRVDLRPVAHQLDHLLCAEPDLARLAGRFLFVLDDGRGDVAGRSLDLGLMAVDDDSAQLRIGSTHWGPVMNLSDCAEALVDLAVRFLSLAGEGEDAPWHVDELPRTGGELIGTAFARDVRTQVRSLATPHGTLVADDGRRLRHEPVPDGVIDRALADRLLAGAGPDVVVTPWRSLIVPEPESTLA